MVDADQRGCFSETVTLNHGKSQPGPECLRFQIQRGTARNKGPELPPEPAMDTAKAPPAFNKVFSPGRFKLLVKPVQLVLRLEIELDLFLQCFQNAWHPYQHRNPLALDRADHLGGIQTFLENDEPLQQLRDEDTEELPEDMTQRQQVQEADRMNHSFVLQIFLNLALERLEVRQDVAMRNHHAFGFRRRSGSKNDLDRVVTPELGFGIGRSGILNRALSQTFERQMRQSGIEPRERIRTDHEFCIYLPRDPQREIQ
jgi:hypothetical protein